MERSSENIKVENITYERRYKVNSSDTDPDNLNNFWAFFEQLPKEKQKKVLELYGCHKNDFDIVNAEVCLETPRKDFIQMNYMKVTCMFIKIY